MKQLDKIFDGRNIIMIEDNGVLYFEVESVGMAIGYVTISKGKEYPHKIRIDKTLKNAEIEPVVYDVQRFITEQQLYDFLIESHTGKSKLFKKWITYEVLPIIKQTGAYIESGREEDMVNYYFSGLSSDLQGKIVTELLDKNRALQ